MGAYEKLVVPLLRANSYLTKQGLYSYILNSGLLLWTNRACVFLSPKGNYITGFEY